MKQEHAIVLARFARSLVWYEFIVNDAWNDVIPGVPVLPELFFSWNSY